MKLYLSGPMTGIDDNNFPAFAHAARELREAGYLVLDPAEKGVIYGWTWEDYLTYDLAELLTADGVATLPGHENSKGAWLETTVAHHLKKTIRPWREWYFDGMMSKLA